LREHRVITFPHYRDDIFVTTWRRAGVTFKIMFLSDSGAPSSAELSRMIEAARPHGRTWPEWLEFGEGQGRDSHCCPASREFTHASKSAFRYTIRRADK
jgi:hypothetical protein